jgi:hypothetical protein
VAPPPDPNREPWRVIPLRFATVSFYDTFCWTWFPDVGEGYGAVPQADPCYERLARRLGYGTDTLRYCLEHDFLHSFLWERAYHQPSGVLYAMATGKKPYKTAGEEAVVQMFQGFLRNPADAVTNPDGWDMTATDLDVDWWSIRQDAYELLDH